MEVLEVWSWSNSLVPLMPYVFAWHTHVDNERESDLNRLVCALPAQSDNSVKHARCFGSVISAFANNSRPVLSGCSRFSTTEEQEEEEEKIFYFY